MDLVKVVAEVLSVGISDLGGYVVYCMFVFEKQAAGFDHPSLDYPVVDGVASLAFGDPREVAGGDSESASDAGDSGSV